MIEAHMACPFCGEQVVEYRNFDTKETDLFCTNCGYMKHFIPKMDEITGRVTIQWKNGQYLPIGKMLVNLTPYGLVRHIDLKGKQHYSSLQTEEELVDAENHILKDKEIPYAEFLFYDVKTKKFHQQELKNV